MYKDKLVNICIPVLNNYSGLTQEILSLEAGTLKPDMYYIINNGLRPMDLPVTNALIQNVPFNVGCAASWNWFIQRVPEIRIICNDDIIWGIDSLQKLLDGYVDDGLLCTPIEMAANIFSCYIISDRVVKEVGLFDENISPRYAYFEDNDYYRRLMLKGLGEVKFVPCSVEHHHSTTLKNFTGLEKQEHHRKFEHAKTRYIQKWGGKPGEEKLTTPNEL